MIDLNKREPMLDQGCDSSLLRFGLVKLHLDQGDVKCAVEDLGCCVELGAGQSVTWKAL